MILLLRVLERVHGHLAWLSVAALAHPAILLRDPRRRARLSVSLAAALTAATAGFGAFIYPDYRVRLKQRLFQEAPSYGWAFERKEHLVVGVVAFALIGCVAHLASPTFESPETRLRVARLAHHAFAIAFALSLIAAAIGLAVASFTSF